MTVTSRRLAGLLAEESRRRVIAALVLADGAVAAQNLAAKAGLELRAVVDAADRLSEIVDHGPDGYTLNGDVFAAAARAEADEAPPSEFGDEPGDIARVLDVAFQDGKLVAFPSKRSKRLVVLDHLAQRFDIGTHYTEAEVNALLAQVHDDVAMLRRWLVDELFLDRAGGRYWRCGGTV